ncbi:MAG: amidohydrolase family protein [Phycisphaerales bacterium]|nr:MAG: amidohydrolase family protein [Phycisphaerales bacterium]
MTTRHMHDHSRLGLAAICLVGLVAIGLPPSAAQEKDPVTIAIRAGKIIPVTSPAIQDGIVLIRDGRIESVGREIEIPDAAEIIDATDKVIIPGLIDAHTTLGEQADDEESVTPDVRARDAFDFFGKYRRMLAGGVTTVYVSPGQRRLVGGLGAVVKLAGESVSDRCLSDAAGLRVTLGELPKNPPTVFTPPIPPDPDHPLLPEQKQLPTTRMAELAVLRKLFAEAQHKGSQTQETPDPKIDVLTSTLGRDLPVRISCHTSHDIRNAISLAEEFELRLILEGATEAYKVIDEIKDSGVPIVVSGILEPGRENAKDYTRDIAQGRVNPQSPAILAKAGVKVALSAPTDETIADLQFIAGYMVRQGLSPEDALAAVTIAPAEILGVADRVGSIEAGKDADLVILTDEPFSLTSAVDKTLVDGQTVYSREAREDEQEAPDKPVLAVRAGKILTADRGQISNGLIVVEGSKISYVGDSKEIPPDATVIDASDSVVIPGMIDIHSHLGLHWDSEPVRLQRGSATTGSGPGRLHAISIAKAVAPDDEAFREVVRCGITSVLLSPATSGLVSGNAALIKTAGKTAEEMTVKEYAAVKFSMLGNSARLAQLWQARDMLKNAKQYAERWEKYERELGEYKHRKPTDKENEVKEPDPPARNATNDLLRRLFKREVPALVHASRADEIRNVLKVFRDEYNLDVIILGGDDAYRIMPELRKYGVGVALGPEILRYEKGKPINNADLLARSGVRIAFHTSATSGTQHLPMNAAYAVRFGMDKDEAFRAITSHPAELLGVDDRIGSIGIGKDADLVILSGEPFDFSSRIQKVIVSGQVVFERDE